MSSAVAELDAILQSMLNLKPPGVSGSKINSITSLCTANVQSESVLIQKIYTHFKKAPGTHKLGVLYVVDSVTRSWVDQAKKSSQAAGSGPDGTFTAGVARITELLPVLMNDIIGSAPEDQKAKIKKLIEIWERSNTFPAAMLSSFKEKLNAPVAKSKQASSKIDIDLLTSDLATTPEGSPAPGFVPLGKPVGIAPAAAVVAAPAAPPQQDTSAILAALKTMAEKNAANQTAAPPTQASLSNVLGAQNGNPPPNALAALFPPAPGPGQSQGPVPPLPGAAPLGQDAQAQIQILQALAAQGIPPDQWATVLQMLPRQGIQTAAPLPPTQATGWGAQNGGASRDRDVSMRSPPSQNRRRSRSPGVDRRRDLSPRRRRDSPGADTYRDARRGNDYRQRSPRRRPSPPPARADSSLPPPGPKNVQWDRSLPRGHIRVLSRTLFVGGVTSSEAHLRSLFDKYGIVQTCIVNVDKRHAFVKMLSRKDAERAREGMEEVKDGATQLRTKWGVGFGPRDCSDYQTGISVIPIERLTDADRKWMRTAEYGGTGGLDIEWGMVVEEPDIEIGAGVSSKAMSRRIATDQGGKRGPQSSKADARKPDRAFDRRHDDRPDAKGPNSNGSNVNSINTSTASMAGVIPNMQMPFPALGNGMPMIPGYQFPFQFAQPSKDQK
ncbi:hypothetical protein DV735_g1431, partial [Chaetothyriales sp. CBS 134920]